MRIGINKFKLKTYFSIIVSIILMPFISVLFAPICIFFYIISVIHYRIAKLKYGNRLDCPAGLDMCYGLLKGKSNDHCNILVEFDGKITVQQLKEHFIKKMQLQVFPMKNRRLRRFQQTFTNFYGYSYFVDDVNFNINKHFSEITNEDLYNDPELRRNPNSIDCFMRDEDLTDKWQLLSDHIMKKYSNIELAKDKPLWHIFVYLQENSYTFLFKYGHVIIDGVHFMRFILEEFSDKAIFQPMPFKYQHPNTFLRYLNFFWAYLLLPMGMKKFYTHPGNNPLHGKELSGKKMRILSERIPIQDIKDVKKSGKTFFNAILFSAIAYAMRCHFREKESKVRKTYVVVPVSLQDLRKEVRTKNSHGFMPIMLTTETKDPENDCALQRLRQTEKDLREAGSDLSFMSVQLAVRMFCPLFPMAMNRVILQAKGLTSGMSNMPGPAKERIQIGNTYSKDMIFWIPDNDPMGMGITFFSSLDKIRIGLQVDSAIMTTNKEAYDFINNIRHEIYNLRDELGLEPVKQQTEICYE